MWQFPWKYKESFTIASGLLVCGILLETTSPAIVPPIRFPYNVVVGIGIIVLCVLIVRAYAKNEIVKWLGSVPASVSAIALFSVLSLLIGFIPQNSPNMFPGLGFTHITSSWQYLFSLLYLSVILCCVTIKRTYPFNMTNLGFILNHLGLLVTLMGISLGTGDKEKFTVNLYVNQTEWRGYNEKHELTELPIAIKLNNFRIEDYNPSIVFVENETGEVIAEKKHTHELLIDSGVCIAKDNWKLKIVQYYPDAAWFEEKFVRFNSKGSVPATYVKAQNDNGEKAEGWISCGNYISPPMQLRLNKSISVAMELPRPKKYQSRVVIYTRNTPPVEKTIGVNRSVNIQGWHIYQSGFDENMGKWSNLSIVQVVRDPWLPVIYTGFFMLMAGAGFIIWKGKTRKK